jgi:hypothetical protein
MTPFQLSRDADKLIPVEELGLCFPHVQLGGIGDELIQHVTASWNNFPLATGRRGGEVRNVCVFVAGGASGTGKTRFGAALPEVLLAAAKRRPGTPHDLVAAVEECAARQLVLQRALEPPLNTSHLPELLLSAYFNPPPTASSRRFEVGAPVRGDIVSAFRLIAAKEREWRPFNGPIAVIVHFDEAQRLAEQGYHNEADAGKLLGLMVRHIAQFLWTNPEINLFPIFYVSGLSRTLVLQTRSYKEPIPINLPLLSNEDYVMILRAVFGFSDDWQPNPPLAHALRCIEGPPRLLLLFLFAMMAVRPIEGDIFGEEVDCSMLRASLNMLDWTKASKVLHRCITPPALRAARLLTFTKGTAECTELFKHIATLVLLHKPVSLEFVLVDEPMKITVNEAIMCGFVLASPATDPQICHLFWPRIYIWALTKVCNIIIIIIIWLDVLF